MRGAILAALLACSASCGTPPPDGACPDDAPDTCVGAAPGFGDVRGTFDAKCVACHSAGGIEASRPLDTYADVFRQRGSVLGQLVSCLMPLHESAPLTASERAVMLQWLVCGAHED